MVVLGWATAFYGQATRRGLLKLAISTAKDRQLVGVGRLASTRVALVTHVRDGLLVNELPLVIQGVIDGSWSSAGHGLALVNLGPFAVRLANDLRVNFSAMQASVRVPSLARVIRRVLEYATFIHANTSYQFIIRKRGWISTRDRHTLLRFSEVAAC
jgi:hypothetical protein